MNDPITSSVQWGHSRRREQVLDAAATVFASSGYTRSSLKDVADRCGVLPGSLYHHFTSKDAIAVELLDRFHRELELLGNSVLGRVASITDADAVVSLEAFGKDLAECVLRHRAAMQLLLYESDFGGGSESARGSQRGPEIIHSAMEALVGLAVRSGSILHDVDRSAFSDQLSCAVRHIGIPVLYLNSDPARSSETVCRILLNGIASKAVDRHDLDRSAAMRAASSSVVSWAGKRELEPARGADIFTAAKELFARHGYEATTIRDIATAAGIGAGTVYRFVESKKALLDLIMARFFTDMSRAYLDVVESDSTSVEKIDALAWVNLNGREYFEQEFRIQRAWFRASPPEFSEVGNVLSTRSAQVRRVLEMGAEAGEIHFAADSVSVMTDCVVDLLWMPRRVVSRVGVRASLECFRGTVLFGAGPRSVR